MLSLFALGLQAGGGQAQTAVQQTLIRAVATEAPPRADVTSACPAVVDTLVRELGHAVRMFGRAGTSDVQFRWTADGAAEVSTRFGPAEYRPAIRRAVRAVECPLARRGDRFVLSIRFEPEPSAGDGQQPWVAVLTPPTRP
jgi:hypothetical protein